ncbi:SURF1 family protein [Shewanella cyperi]|uniref:SURF1-like protein n=1 Tax=Shewanella cyperi TaxID=2814292 RepID=A0A974XMF5_9GAMM|nr:SURF1 family protein [Shewanella cyperi]QSX29968.1 SURF1 family protein [Shewanella cyperi]
MKFPVTVSASRLGLVLFTLGLFVVLVKLGLWQLSRAEEKTLLARQMEQRQDRELSVAELERMPESELTGYRLKVEGRFLSPVLLLDNQVYQGKVGYLVYRVLDSGAQKKLLVEQGFIAAPATRDQLPDVPVPPDPVVLSGRLYQRHSNPLSPGLGPEIGAVTRIQNLELAELERFLALPLQKAVLQPDKLPGAELPRQWLPMPMAASKHLGYAVQWFALAWALLLLSLWAWWRSSKQDKPSQELTSTGEFPGQ